MMLIEALLGQMQWYRKLRGGRWEYVRNTALMCWGWFRVDLPSTCESLALCERVLRREDWRR